MLYYYNIIYYNISEQKFCYIFNLRIFYILCTLNKCQYTVESLLPCCILLMCACVF